tara:strand:- start:6546 stop:7010 length:465 start_codon:yes stop_codon:yes gene_type:complete
MSAKNTPTIAKRNRRRYLVAVTANSVTGFGHPITVRRTSATVPKVGAFFMPATSLYGGCARGAFERAGCLTSRLTNLRTAATHSFGHERGGSSTLGAVPMKHARNPSTPSSHADAYKAMALAALRADSSLSVRLARYNSHMAKARALEAAGGAV